TCTVGSLRYSRSAPHSIELRNPGSVKRWPGRTANCSVGGHENFKTASAAHRNLEFQQNLSQTQLRVILLVAPSNALEDLLPLVPCLLLASIPKSRPGRILRVDA